MIEFEETKMKKRKDLRADLPVDLSAELRRTLALAVRKSSCRLSSYTVYLSSPSFAQGRDFFVEFLMVPW